jgi:hypothetical protein
LSRLRSKPKKSPKKVSKTARILVPRPIFEFVMTQLILRGAGFKSSEITTLIKEVAGHPNKTSIHLRISRKEKESDLMTQIGVGTIDYPLAQAEERWERWLELAYLSVVKNFADWQTKSLAYGSIEDILTSLEKTGFTISDADISETFDVLKQIH